MRGKEVRLEIELGDWEGVRQTLLKARATSQSLDRDRVYLMGQLR